MVLHLKKKRIQGKLTRSTQEIDETTDVDKDMEVDVDETTDVDKDMEVDVDEKHELSHMEMVNKKMKRLN